MTLSSQFNSTQLYRIAIRLPDHTTLEEDVLNMLPITVDAIISTRTVSDRCILFLPSADRLTELTHHSNKFLSSGTGFLPLLYLIASAVGYLKGVTDARHGKVSFLCYIDRTDKSFNSGMFDNSHLLIMQYFFWNDL